MEQTDSREGRNSIQPFDRSLTAHLSQDNLRSLQATLHPREFKALTPTGKIMQQDGCQPLSFILRRFICPQEAIELVIEDTGGVPRQSTSCRIWSGQDDDANGIRAYGITLPGNVLVRPVDWRRFAYDHEKVAALIRSCACDNFGLAYCDLDFSAEEYVGRFENVLMRALQDLSSIFDVKSVKCELLNDRALTEVTGDFKNGEAACICIDLPAPASI